LAAIMGEERMLARLESGAKTSDVGRGKLRRRPSRFKVLNLEKGVLGSQTVYNIVSNTCKPMLIIFS